MARVIAASIDLNEAEEFCEYALVINGAQAISERKSGSSMFTLYPVS
jgi:hypothetical protein